jgi:hypothetical protein
MVPVSSILFDIVCVCRQVGTSARTCLALPYTCLDACAHDGSGPDGRAITGDVIDMVGVDYSDGGQPKIHFCNTA